MYVLSSIFLKNNSKQQFLGGRPKMTIFIGLLGRAGAGKDTTAIIMQDIFVKSHMTCKLYSFADELKKMISTTLEIPLEYFHNRALKESPLPNYTQHTPRSLMVWFGTIMKQQFGESFWIDFIQKKIDWQCDVAIITDVRFPLEMDFICSKGGTIFYIDRDEILQPLDINTAHISETAVKQTASMCQERYPIQFCHINNNKHSLQELEHEIVSQIYKFDINK